MVKSVIKGLGSALPSKLITNDELARRVDTSDEWIKSRTGIKRRYICTDEETTSTLATKAAQEAILDACVDKNDIDLIIVATSTPDYDFPAVASQIQKELAITGAAFDVQAACSGFIYGLGVADSLIKTGKHKNVIVIGVDTFSNIMDWNDRSTCVLFGDGAGAVVLSAGSSSNSRGIIGVDMFGDGSHVNELYSTSGVAIKNSITGISMNGREVFRYASRHMAELLPFMLDKYNISQGDITKLIPHQANLRIIEATAKILGLPMEKVILTVDKHANTSAASIPLALDWAKKNGEINKGDLLFLVAFGAGFSWAASFVEF